MAKRRKAIENRAKHLLEYVRAAWKPPKCSASNAHISASPSRRNLRALTCTNPAYCQWNTCERLSHHHPPRQDRDCSRDQGRQ